VCRPGVCLNLTARLKHSVLFMSLLTTQVYVEPSSMGWVPLKTSWMATLPATVDAAGEATVSLLLGLVTWAW
jgi:hypothetical protein